MGGDGLPVLLYTGVRLRSNAGAGPPPPPEHDLQLPFVESQLVAVPELDPEGGDPLLSRWRKLEVPALPLPPANLPLVGWRDPFIFEVKGEKRIGGEEGLIMAATTVGGEEEQQEQSENGNGDRDHHHREWGMLLGSGFKGRGGTVLIYRSDDLHGGWRFEGTLCEADSVDTGAMWECPLIARLSEREGGEGGSRGSVVVSNNIVPAPPTTSSSSVSAAAKEGGDVEAAAAISVLKLDDGGEDSREKEEGRRQRKDEADDDADGAASTSSISSASGSRSSSRRPHTHDHFFCVSPDAPTNPVLYWTGPFDPSSTRFGLEEASGPHRLDLGDVLYAPNLMSDAQGRRVLWGWLQERRGSVGSYDYAGCLSLPRLLSLKDGKLFQEPLPEVALLREDDPKLLSWSAESLSLPPEVATPVEGVRSPRLDVSVTLERGSAVAAGVLVRSWNAGGEGSAAIVIDWESGVLEAVFEGGDEGMAAAAAAAAAANDADAAAAPPPPTGGQRRIGGPVDLGPPGTPITMRVLLDHSACEVFLSTGQVLSTRVYRGTPPLGADAGVDLVSYGGVAVASRVEAFEMGTSAIIPSSPSTVVSEGEVGEEETSTTATAKRRRGGLLGAVAAKQQAQAAAAAASAKPTLSSSSSVDDGTLSSALPAAYEPMAPAVGSAVAT